MMFSLIKADEVKKDFIVNRDKIKSIHFDLTSIENHKDQLISYKKLKENSEAEFNLMELIFKIEEDMEKNLKDLDSIKRDPIYQMKLDKLHEKVNDLLTNSVRIIKRSLATRFDHVELELWNKIKETKAVLWPLQLQIFVYEYKMFLQNAKDSTVEHLKIKLETIRREFKTIFANNIANIINENEIDRKRKLVESVYKTIEQKKLEIDERIDDLRSSLDCHIERWRYLSGLWFGFLFDVFGTKCQIMNKVDYMALQNKLNDVVAIAKRKPKDYTQELFFELWSEMLQHNNDRIRKANTILAALIKKRDILWSDGTNEYFFRPKTDNNFQFVLNSLITLIERFTEYPYSLGDDENKFLTFIERVHPAVGEPSFKTISDSLRKVEANVKTSYGSAPMQKAMMEEPLNDMIIRTLDDFCEHGWHTIESLSGRQSINLEEKALEWLAKLDSLSRSNREFLDSQAVSFHYISAILGLK